MSQHLTIKGIGSYVPETVLTNDDFVKRGMNTSDEWIKSRTGISERRILDKDKPTSFMAYEAAKNAIQDAGISVTDIELIVVATSTADFDGFPSLACQLQAKLELPGIPAFDISAACTGFNYALTTAEQYVRNGFVKTALVVGVDALSKIVDWSDRGTCILFGDGAGAAVVQASDYDGLVFSGLFADGRDAPILTVENKTIFMEGRAVFKSAVSNVVPAVEECLIKAGIDKSDVDVLIPHQANIRIIDQMRKRLDLPEEKVVTNLDRYGNTSAASIPIALCEAKDKGLLKPGALVMLVGFGAGFTWGVSIIRWEK
jgi:3-oxoacyl-[acyl-carrier-protein] synthase-3